MTAEIEGLAGPDVLDLVEEMRGAQLGDRRRNERLLQVMEHLASNPGASLASMCDTEAEREALYRFLRNRQVDWEQVLRPHTDRTKERARQTGRVLALHDTSSFRVADSADFESYINTGKRGFLAHASLLVDANDPRRPLGVAAMEILRRPKRQRRTKKNGRPMTGAETTKLKGRESRRWFRGVTRAASGIEELDIVHVMDREGDSYELLADLQREGHSFVIRWCKDRNARLEHEDDGSWGKVSHLLMRAKDTSLVRDVAVGKRAAKTAPGANKASPARPRRTANLRITHAAVELKKPRYLKVSDGFPPSLMVNVVRVYEPAPPDGEPPIEWVLLTNLPVTQPDDIEEIVDIYRQRWLIEEFFKALKTGCSYRKRYLSNESSILNTLAALVPIAWKALALRKFADGSQQPATRVLQPEELAVLRAKAHQMGKPLPKTPTADHALALVAQLGGHRKSGGPPGWLTLMRGTEKLQTLAEGWLLAQDGKM